MRQEVIHHDTVPELSIIAMKSWMSSNFDPIVLYYILKSFVTGQRCKSSFHSKIFDIINLKIFHSKGLKCQILFLNLFKLLINLTNQIFSLQSLEWTIVKLENLKIFFNKPWIFILRYLFSTYFVIQISQWFIDKPSWNNASEEIHYLVNSGCSLKIITT